MDSDESSTEGSSKDESVIEEKISSHDKDKKSKKDKKDKRDKKDKKEKKHKKDKKEKKSKKHKRDRESEEAISAIPGVVDQNQFGKYGIIREDSFFYKQRYLTKSDKLLATKE